MMNRGDDLIEELMKLTTSRCAHCNKPRTITQLKKMGEVRRKLESHVFQMEREARVRNKTGEFF